MWYGNRTYIGGHDCVGGTAASVVRRQVGRTADIVRSTSQRTRTAVVVSVDLVSGAVNVAVDAFAAFRLDGTLPRRVLTHAARKLIVSQEIQ